MDPIDVTQRYFASIRARDLDGLIGLYAEDACFTLPNGREFHGTEAIRENASERLCGGRSKPHPALEHCRRRLNCGGNRGQAA